MKMLGQLGQLSIKRKKSNEVMVRDRIRKNSKDKEITLTALTTLTLQSPDEAPPGRRGRSKPTGTGAGGNFSPERKIKSGGEQFIRRRKGVQAYEPFDKAIQPESGTTTGNNP